MVAYAGACLLGTIDGTSAQDFLGVGQFTLCIGSQQVECASAVCGHDPESRDYLPPPGTADSDSSFTAVRDVQTTGLQCGQRIK